MTNALLRRTLNAPFLMITLLAILACSFASSGSATKATADQGDPTISFEQLVNDTFRLRDSELITLDIDPTPGIEHSIVVTIEGEAYTLNLAPYSVRADSYQVMMEYPNDEIEEFDPIPVRTVRGSVAELPDSIIAGSVLDDGLHAVIVFDEDNTYWIEPLGDRVDGAAEGEHVIYHAYDVIPSGGKCGNDTEGVGDHLEFGDLGTDARQAMGGEVCGVTELGCDADEEYLNAHGGTVVGVVNRIEYVINTVNIQYENQVGISHLITAILIHTNPPGTLPGSGTEGETFYPYTSTNYGALLDSLVSHWNSAHTDIPHDLVHLFTGKDLNGGVIGVANCIGCVCSSFAFCLSQSDCCGSDACSTDLTAHELGHVWNGVHCDPCSTTMRSYIGCFNNFTGSNINRITNHRNGRWCLDCPESSTTPLPFFDDFPTTTIDPNLWTGIEGAASNSSGNGEPSSPYSLNLDNSDKIRSAIMDTSGSDLILISYWWQRAGYGGTPDPGEDLYVEYLNVADAWIELSVHPGDGPGDDPYQFVEMELPAGSRHSGFRLRFRASGDSSTDDWLIDDVFVGTPPEDATTTLPFIDEFPSTEINTELWIGIDGASIDDQGVGEPSAPYSLNLDGVDEIRSALMDTTGGMDLSLNYSWQQTGGGDHPDENDYLVVDYLNDLDIWIELDSHAGGGPDADPYEQVSLPLPDDALYGGFRFRFRSIGTTGGQPAGWDDWFVDDVCVGTAGECQNGAPCGGPEDCDDGVACTDDNCLSNFCVNTPINVACNDGVACTTDVCVFGIGCENTADDAACDDSNGCTTDSCNAGSGCVNAPDVGQSCDDGQECTTNDACDENGQCTGADNGCVTLDAGLVSLPICQDTSQEYIDVPLDVCQVSALLISMDDTLVNVGNTVITTTDPDGFYQHQFGNGNLSPACNLIAVFPDLVCDSFVTIGVACSDGTDTSSLDPDFDSCAFNCDSTSGACQDNTLCGEVIGGWFNGNPSNDQGDPDENLRVLIAQFAVAQGQTVAGTTDAFVRIAGEVFVFPDLEFICNGGDSPCNVDCPTDVDIDGQTGPFDLAVLLGCWGPVTPGSMCECLDNGDGSIDAFDLALLLGDWGPCD